MRSDSLLAQAAELSPEVRAAVEAYRKASGAPTLPAYMSIEQWCRFAGMSRRVVYDKLGSGELKAMKLGAKTLIDVWAGVVFLRSLPVAKIRPMTVRKTPYVPKAYVPTGRPAGRPRKHPAPEAVAAGE